MNGKDGQCGEMEFSFKRQVNEINQKQAVKLCQDYQARNGIELKNVSEDSNWFKTGADLIQETPDNPILIDVKCDERMAETGNIAFELVEVCSYKGFIKEGWAFSKVDYIFYVDWHNKINYVFALPNLKYDAYLKARQGFSAYHPNEKYFTLGILLPINELTFKKHNLLE